MAEIQADQTKTRETHINSFNELEEKYLKQINNLQDNLHRVLADNDSKDSHIKQVRSMVSEPRGIMLSKSDLFNDFWLVTCISVRWLIYYYHKCY